MNASCRIFCQESITLGRDCVVVWEDQISDADLHPVPDLASVEPEVERALEQPTVIGNHVWIGGRAMILKGVVVGVGAIVAAGAVETRSVPPYSLVGGNPMRVIRGGVSWC